MAAPHSDTWSLEEDDVATASFEQAREHDAFWEEAHARENYFRPGLDYEDYAPAYCVGYTGHAQYGGDYADAEKSLLSNWVRIKGDSRLSLEEAQMAMRAAWDRAEAVAAGVTDVQHTDVREPAFARAARRFLETANDWLDGALGARPAHKPVARPIARRAQQSGFARH